MALKTWHACRPTTVHCATRPIPVGRARYVIAVASRRKTTWTNPAAGSLSRRLVPAAAFDSEPEAAESTFGLFVCSGSPTVAEALSHSGVDWLCLDMQHGPVGYTELAGLLQASSSGRVQKIVRVGGPSDRFGIQQALDQGADGVMVPLVNSLAEAKEAVSYCRFPPEGQRSLVAPSRAILVQEGYGGAAVGRYLQEANRRVQVWLQVESLQCLDALDEILGTVPGIDCMFLGPADMAVSMGLMELGGGGGGGSGGGGGGGGSGSGGSGGGGGGGSGSGSGGGGAAAAASPGSSPPGQGRYTDLASALWGPEMAEVHRRVIEACRRHGVAPGCFCVGPARARELAELGYTRAGFDTDVNMAINAAAAAMQRIKTG